MAIPLRLHCVSDTGCKDRKSDAGCYAPPVRLFNVSRNHSGLGLELGTEMGDNVAYKPSQRSELL
jgi:hypothetical protein